MCTCIHRGIFGLEKGENYVISESMNLEGITLNEIT
jgi:hypothetical protein